MCTTPFTKAPFRVLHLFKRVQVFRLLESKAALMDWCSPMLRLKKRSVQVLGFKDLFFIDLELFNIKARPWFEPSTTTRRSNATLQRSGLLYFTAARPSELVQRSPLHTHICTYAYWTVHHLDSWIKRDQLDVTCFIISLFNAQHVSDVTTSILRSLRLICWVISWVVLFWFVVCWCCVVVWLQPAYGYHNTPAKPHRNTNTHRTRTIQPMK